MHSSDALPNGAVVDIINEDGKGSIVLLCEHASCYIPEVYQGLGLSSAFSKSHAAWDPGALELAESISGDIYEKTTATEIPTTLRGSIKILKQSTMMREALGDDVVDHYYRAGEWEQEEFDQVVTDYEIARGFERA